MSEIYLNKIVYSCLYTILNTHVLMIINNNMLKAYK